MNDPLRGPLEARVLAVERLLNGMEDDLRTLDRKSIALWQGVWDSWSDVRKPPPMTTKPSPCGFEIPDALTLIDPNYPSVPIIWDGVANWAGCQVVSYPGFGVCPAAVGCPIFYTLFGDHASTTWTLRIAWVDHNVGGFGCPLAGQTCSSTPNIHFDYTATINCAGTTIWGGTSAGFIYAGNTTPVWTITLP